MSGNKAGKKELTIKERLILAQTHEKNGEWDYAVHELERALRDLSSLEPELKKYDPEMLNDLLLNELNSTLNSVQDHRPPTFQLTLLSEALGHQTKPDYSVFKHPGAEPIFTVVTSKYEELFGFKDRGEGLNFSVHAPDKEDIPSIYIISFVNNNIREVTKNKAGLAWVWAHLTEANIQLLIRTHSINKILIDTGCNHIHRALLNFDCALFLKPGYTWALSHKAETYRVTANATLLEVGYQDWKIKRSFDYIHSLIYFSEAFPEKNQEPDSWNLAHLGATIVNVRAFVSHPVTSSIHDTEEVPWLEPLTRHMKGKAEDAGINVRKAYDLLDLALDLLEEAQFLVGGKYPWAQMFVGGGMIIRSFVASEAAPQNGTQSNRNSVTSGDNDHDWHEQEIDSELESSKNKLMTHLNSTKATLEKAESELQELLNTLSNSNDPQNQLIIPKTEIHKYLKDTKRHLSKLEEEQKKHDTLITRSLKESNSQRGSAQMGFAIGAHALYLDPSLLRSVFEPGEHFINPIVVLAQISSNRGNFKNAWRLGRKGLNKSFNIRGTRALDRLIIYGFLISVWEDALRNRIKLPKNKIRTPGPRDHSFVPKLPTSETDDFRDFIRQVFDDELRPALALFLDKSPSWGMFVKIRMGISSALWVIREMKKSVNYLIECKADSSTDTKQLYDDLDNFLSELNPDPNDEKGMIPPLFKAKPNQDSTDDVDLDNHTAEVDFRRFGRARQYLSLTLTGHLAYQAKPYN